MVIIRKINYFLIFAVILLSQIHKLALYQKFFKIERSTIRIMTKKFGLHNLNTAIKEEERGQKNNVRIHLEPKQSILVRIPNLETCSSYYMSHSFYDEKNDKNNVLPFACDKERDPKAADPFDKASEYLLAQAKVRYDNKEYGEGNPDPDYIFGKSLKASMRIQFGFYNLEEGKEFIIELAPKHANPIKEAIEKKADKIGTFAFELTRSGSKSESTYSLTPCIDDLTDVQQKNFEECAKPFDTDLYQSSIHYKSETEQLKSLQKIGFDITLIGYDPSSLPVDDNKVTPISEENHNQQDEKKMPESQVDGKFYDDIDEAIEQSEASA